MTTLTKDILLQIIPSASTTPFGVDVIVAELNAVFSNTMDGPALNTVNRQAGFITMTAVESWYYHTLEENLHYSSSALLKLWPNRFDSSSANAYAFHADEIANRVYANRMGNGDETTGDGWKYHGRGFFQLTGKYMYNECEQHLPYDLINHPELLCNVSIAMESAEWYWHRLNMTKFADVDDIAGMTKAINGGLTGLADRTTVYNKAKQLLKP